MLEGFDIAPALDTIQKPRTTWFAALDRFCGWLFRVRSIEVRILLEEMMRVQLQRDQLIGAVQAHHDVKYGSVVRDATVHSLPDRTLYTLAGVQHQLSDWGARPSNLSQTSSPVMPRTRHEWGPSKLGHGDAQCIHCRCTNREAALIAPVFCVRGPP